MWKIDDSLWVAQKVESWYMAILKVATVISRGRMLGATLVMAFSDY